MRALAAILGLWLVLLFALGLGVLQSIFVLAGLTFVAGGVWLVLAFAARVERETAERSSWVDPAPLEQAAPVAGGGISFSVNARLAPYALGGVAALTVLAGVCGARLLEGDSGPSSLVARPTAPSAVPTATVAPATPSPSPTTELIVVTPPVIAATPPLALPDDPEDCPPGRKKRDRC